MSISLASPSLSPMCSSWSRWALWKAVFYALGGCWEAASWLGFRCVVLRKLIFPGQLLYSPLWWYQQKLWLTHWWWHRSWIALTEQRLGFEFQSRLPLYFVKHFLDCEMTGQLKDEWEWERARFWEELDPNPGSTVKLGKLFYHLSNCSHNCSVKNINACSTVVYQCLLYKAVIRI